MSIIGIVSVSVCCSLGETGGLRGEWQGSMRGSGVPTYVERAAVLRAGGHSCLRPHRLKSLLVQSRFELRSESAADGTAAEPTMQPPPRKVSAPTLQVHGYTNYLVTSNPKTYSPQADKRGIQSCMYEQ